MRISEIFLSIQGEGRLVGTTSAFVRLAGCDLRCRWCDTPYALEATQGKKTAINDILARLAEFNCTHVVITGGEPLIEPELPEFLQALSKTNRHITVETNATRFRKITCDLISISPKLSNSIPIDSGHTQKHKQNKLNIPAIRDFILRHDYQLKFVVDNETDLPEIEHVLNELQNYEEVTEIDKNKVLLMPQGRTKQQLRRLGPVVAEMCVKTGYRYCPRLHIELWGSQRKR